MMGGGNNNMNNQISNSSTNIVAALTHSYGIPLHMLVNYLNIYGEIDRQLVESAFDKLKHDVKEVKDIVPSDLLKGRNNNCTDLSLQLHGSKSTGTAAANQNPTHPQHLSLLRRLPHHYKHSLRSFDAILHLHRLN